MADQPSAREFVRVQLRLGVPPGEIDRQYFGLAVNVRLTTFGLLICGAIAAAVLYFVNELIRTTARPDEIAPADTTPTPIARLAPEAQPRS